MTSSASQPCDSAPYTECTGMNVEKTMEFILQQQAKAEVQMAEMRQQQAKTDRQIKAIQKLITAGMKMIVKQGESIKQLADAQKELANAQKVTEVKLQGLIDALRQGGNGTRSKH